MRIRTMLLRQWRLIKVLEGRRRGLKISSLIDELGVSRATLYRDLALLEEAGILITIDTINGEAWYRLLEESHPVVFRSPLQLAALRLARNALAPLEGSSLVTEIDALLCIKKSRVRMEDKNWVSLLPRRQNAIASHIKLIEGAIRSNRRIRFVYRSVSNQEPHERTVDPAELRLVDAHLYLVGFDLERKSMRTFKIARIASIQETGESAQRHETDNSVDGCSLHSVKIWSSDPIEVVVRIAPDVAWLIHEWPLMPGQTVETEPSKSVLVKAKVAGIVEAMRWVLSWGCKAHVIAPADLRNAVKYELLTALETYAQPGPKKTKQLVSPIVRRGRVTKRKLPETAGDEGGAG